MIVRILTEGQYDVADDEIDALNALDGQLEEAIEAGDEQAFRDSLNALLDRVRTTGTAVAPDALIPSDLLLPYADATLAEVRDLLGDEGLIPGR